MPNADKLIKNALHEISDGKAALQEVSTLILNNQQQLIGQNQSIINLLSKIASAADNKPSE